MITILIAALALQVAEESPREKVLRLSADLKGNRQQILDVGLRAIRPLYEIGSFEAIALAHELKLNHYSNEDPPCRLAASLTMTATEASLPKLIKAIMKALGYRVYLDPEVAMSTGSATCTWRNIRIGDALQQILIKHNIDWAYVRGVMVFARPDRLWPVPTRNPEDPDYALRLLRAYCSENRPEEALKVLIDSGAWAADILPVLLDEFPGVFTSGQANLVRMACRPPVYVSRFDLEGTPCGRRLARIPAPAGMGPLLREVQGILEVDAPDSLRTVPSPLVEPGFNLLTHLYFFAIQHDVRITQGPDGVILVRPKPRRKAVH